MTKDDIRLLKHYISPYLPKLLIITILAVVCAFFEAVNLGTLVPLLQLMDSPTPPGGTLWEILRWSFNLVGIELDVTNLLLAIMGVFLAGQALLFIKKHLEVKLKVGFIYSIRERIFADVFGTDMQYHHRYKQGNFLNAIFNETNNAGSGLFAATELMTDVFFIAIYAVMLMYISVEMTVVCLVFSGISLWLMNAMLRNSSKLGKELVVQNTRQTEFIAERFNLLRLIKTSSTEQLEADKYGAISSDLRKTHCGYEINGIKIETIFQTVIFLLAIFIIFISLSVISLQTELLLVFLFILIRITTPLRDLNMRRHTLAKDLASFSKIDEIIIGAAAGYTILNGKTLFQGLKREIKLDNVIFSYNSGTRVIRGISCTIPKNKMIALVGASGGGKSTLVDLVIRLIDPDAGTISIDGTDIREFDIASYHAKIGVVSQDIYIFNDTVLNNICYGSDRFSLPDAIEAAKLANAHEFITNLSDGYDTSLGDRGLKLSGGQKQRIALARAFYKNPDILILDEATSALDTESEIKIQNSINQIRQRYTVIAIAHRLSTIRNADSIAVVENGRIVETGTHAELVGKKDVYSKYYHMQYDDNRDANAGTESDAGGDGSAPGTAD